MDTERSSAAPGCINLRERFGRRYRVEYEESYFAEYGSHARVEDPAYMILLCKYGHIYPAGGNLLAASVDGHPIVANRLGRLPCCRVEQDGDFGELTVVFDVADFDTVARIMRPRRRRRLSAAHRDRLVAAGAASRFTPQSGAQRRATLSLMMATSSRFARFVARRIV